MSNPTAREAECVQLTRAYILNIVHQDLLIAAGLKTCKKLRFAKGTRTTYTMVNGKREPVQVDCLVIEEYEDYDRSHQAGATHSKLILEYVGPEGANVPAPGQIDDRSDFRELFRQFQDKRRKEEAALR